jgi:anti-sigma factor ChrR (cupin superfamily)
MSQDLHDTSLGKSAEENTMADAKLFEQFVLALQPVELSEQRRSGLRQKILQQAREQAPAGTVTRRATQGTWFALDPKVQIKVLRCDKQAGNQTILMRIASGGMIPGHQHTQEEEFVILEGECHVGSHRLSAGDVHIAAAGSWHDDITTQSGVLVLMRGEYPPPLMSAAVR